MQDPKPFWETGIHPVTGKKEFTKILNEDQKERARNARVNRKKLKQC